MWSVIHYFSYSTQHIPTQHIQHIYTNNLSSHANKKVQKLHEYVIMCNILYVNISNYIAYFTVYEIPQINYGQFIILSI